MEDEPSCVTSGSVAQNNIVASGMCLHSTDLVAGHVRNTRSENLMSNSS